ncbi:MAG: Smr/MutS family protein [Betaproteobacteria bacterium]|nr:Smr/MutS family protein [Betaproteobacteria bacterium]
MRAGRSPPKTGEAPSARDEFLAAVDSVKRLPPSDRVPPPPARPPAVARQRQADEAAALEAARAGWSALQDEDFEPEQSFIRPGLRTDTLRKLRRRFWSIQAQLDLHGHTRAEAHQALSIFLTECRSAGWRCVRIIHGKGLSSPNQEPVLKSPVRRWLQRNDQVLAYCEPAAVDGGSGAVLVLLKAS